MRNRIREAPPGRLLLLAACFAFCFGVPGSGAVAEELNRIVLRVNDEIFTLFDYESRKAAEIGALLSQQGLSSSEQQEQLAQMGRRIMKTTMEEMLLRSRAEQIGVRIDDVQVEEAILQIREEQGFNDDQGFRDALRAAGINLSQLRERMRRDLSVNQVLGREVWSQITLPEEALRSYYRNHQDEFRTPERRQVREIIALDSSGLADEELLQLATEIREQAVAGKDLAELVASYREEGMTSGVIDHEWLDRRDLEEALSEVAWSLQEDAYSEPVRARGGYHVMHVAAVEEERILPFVEVQEQIASKERGRLFQKTYGEYLAKLEERSYIFENLPPDAVGYRSLGETGGEESFDFFGEAVAEEKTGRDERREEKRERRGQRKERKRERKGAEEEAEAGEGSSTNGAGA